MSTQCSMKQNNFNLYQISNEYYFLTTCLIVMESTSSLIVFFKNSLLLLHCHSVEQMMTGELRLHADTELYSCSVCVFYYVLGSTKKCCRGS